MWNPDEITWRPPRWGLGGGGVDVQGRMPASTPSEAVESARILKLVCIVEMNTSCEMETINIFKHHASKDQATSTLMKQGSRRKMGHRGLSGEPLPRNDLEMFFEDFFRINFGDPGWNFAAMDSIGGIAMELPATRVLRGPIVARNVRSVIDNHMKFTRSTSFFHVFELLHASPIWFSQLPCNMWARARKMGLVHVICLVKSF